MYIPMGSKYDLLNSGVKVASRFVEAAGTKAGNNIAKSAIAWFAQPIAIDLGEKLRREIHDDVLKTPWDDEDDSLDLPEKKDFWKKIKENFAVGDALSVGGLLALFIQDRFNKTPGKLGLFQAAIKNIATVATFAGTLLASIGRFTNIRNEHALGENNVAKWYLNKGDRLGYKIFHKFSDHEINKLEEKAEKLNRKLIYEDSVEPEILQRHWKFTADPEAGNEVGGLLCGEPGTGKTDGVYTILGNLSKQIKNAGMKPVFAQLDLGNFAKFLQEMENVKADTNQALGALIGNDKASLLNLESDTTLTILDALISKSSQIAQKVKFNNAKPNAQKEILVLFVDEFEKVFPVNKLHNVDQTKWVNALLRFNKLLEGENILLTSNLPKNKLLDRVKKSLQEEGDDHNEVYLPFQSRLDNIHIHIARPDEKIQAKIIAANLLNDYKEHINWNEFGVEENTGLYELDKTLLAESIYQLITKPQETSFTGRDIHFAMGSLKPYLINLAEKLRINSEKPIADSDWNAMSPDEKIQTTEASITPNLIIDLLKNKVQTLQSGANDKNMPKALSIMEVYIENIAEHSKDAIGFRSDSVLELLDKVYLKNKSELKDTYRSKIPIKIDNDFYIHQIVFDKPNIHNSSSEGTLKIEFFKFNPETKTISNEDKQATKSIALNDFSSMFTEPLNSSLESASSKKFNSAVQELSKYFKQSSLGSNENSFLNSVVDFALNSNASKNLRDKVLSKPT